MSAKFTTATPVSRGPGAFLLMALCLVAALSVLFYRAFLPHIVVFSNDGPLGVQNNASLALPGAFRGVWYTSWIGGAGGYVYADLTMVFEYLVGPEGFAKFYEPFALLFLGLCAWPFYRTLGLNSGLSIVACLATALNGNFFSNTAWGLGSRAITLGFIFLALAALNARRYGNPWLNAILAGLAVGFAVVEGADNGMIFSLYVAAFVIMQSLVQAKSIGCGMVKSTRLILVTLFAVFMATQALVGLLGLAQKGAVTATDNAQTRDEKWVFATEWSLPPVETLRVIIPGLYGYRMDGTDADIGKAYWGRVGEMPGAPEQMRRFNGSGEYAGLLVVLLALWAASASFNGKMGVFATNEKRMIWFWSVCVLISVPLSWGRFVPIFYRCVYALPYFSSIRNPMKFMHPAHLGLMILFAYGLLGLSRRYLEKPVVPGARKEGLKARWARALPFEHGYIWMMILLLAASAVSYVVYSDARPELIKYIASVDFGNDVAKSIAADSIREVGLYVAFLALSAGLLVLIMAGIFSGKRAPWAVLLLGVILVSDLGRANKPWIVFWDVSRKYATNPVLNILRTNAFESRVVSPPFLMNDQALSQYEDQFEKATGMRSLTHLYPELYSIEWVQHHYPYYDIQSLDSAQDPRPPANKMAYLTAMRFPPRYWELTSTRYLFGMAGYLDALNQQMDEGRNRFRIKATFDIFPKPGLDPSRLTDLTAEIVTNGPLALFEFTGALPRAGLYSHWQVVTNDDAALKELASPAFDPASAVLVSDPIQESASPSNANHGTVAFKSYSPRHIELSSSAPAPTVLLLNDQYDPNWHVTVDGKPVPLLRCNYIMRGVELPPGDHAIVFDFEPPLGGMKVSLVAEALGAVLCIAICLVRQPEDEPEPVRPGPIAAGKKA